MNLGFLKIHRKMRNSIAMSEPTATHIWILILMEANWKADEGLKRGEFEYTVLGLSSNWGLARNTITKWLKIFEENGMIKTRQTDRRERILTVCNYSEYQGKCSNDEQLPADKCSNDEHLKTVSAQMVNSECSNGEQLSVQMVSTAPYIKETKEREEQTAVSSQVAIDFENVDSFSEKFKTLWNSQAKEHGFEPFRSWSPEVARNSGVSRLDALGDRLADPKWGEESLEALDRIVASIKGGNRFYVEGNKVPFCANINWFLREHTVTKILERQERPVKQRPMDGANGNGRHFDEGSDLSEFCRQLDEGNAYP